MHDVATSGGSIPRQWSRSDRGLAPYLIVGMCWLGLAILTLSIRVPVRLWHPIFDWAFSQAVLTEQLFPTIVRWQTYGIWLAVYGLLGMAAWFTVEKPLRPARAHVWRRATVAWLVIQLSYWIVSLLLIAKGVIAE